MQLEDRALAIGRQAAGDAENRRFSQRRIEDLLRKLSGKLLREAKHATFGIFDIFAKDDASRIFFQAGAQCFVYRVADAVFPGGRSL